MMSVSKTSVFVYNRKLLLNTYKSKIIFTLFNNVPNAKQWNDGRRVGHQRVKLLYIVKLRVVVRLTLRA